MRDRGSNNKSSECKQRPADLVQPKFGPACTECESIVSQDDDYVFSCTLCKSLYHGRCLDFDESSLDLINAVFDSISWTCNSCQTRAKSVLDRGKISTQPQNSGKQNLTLQTKLTSLENEVTSLQARISSLESLMTGLTSVRSSKPVAQNSQSLGNPISEDTASPPITSAQGNSRDHLKINEIKNSVMEAVHGDLLNKKHRQRNLVITGLKPSSTIADKDLFKDLYASHFSTRPIPEPVLCRRLIPKDHNKQRNNVVQISPLLVVLPSEAQAQYILLNARSLRESTRDHIRNHVYINRDLTKAEAAAEYEHRQKRREKAKQSQAIKPPEVASDDVMHHSTVSRDDFTISLNNSTATNNPPGLSSDSNFPPLSSSKPSSSHSSISHSPSSPPPSSNPGPHYDPPPPNNGQSKVTLGNKWLV